MLQQNVLAGLQYRTSTYKLLFFPTAPAAAAAFAAASDATATVSALYSAVPQPPQYMHGGTPYTTCKQHDQDLEKLMPLLDAGGSGEGRQPASVATAS